MVGGRRGAGRGMIDLLGAVVPDGTSLSVPERLSIHIYIDIFYTI